MGKIRVVASAVDRCLYPDTDMGRGRPLSISDERASRLHATLRWVDREWQISDKTSRNGTFVDGVPIPRDRAVPLRLGQWIGLGAARRDFELVDVAPPRAFARNALDGREIEEDAAGRIELDFGVLSETHEGWRLTREDGEVPAAPEHILPWTIHIPEHHLPTQRNGVVLDECSLRFHVSLRADTVGLVLVTPTGEVDFGRSENFYPLLVLARGGTTNGGWVTVEHLLRKSKMKKGYLDVSLGRVRRLVLLANVIDGAGLFEVVRGKRRLRIPPERVREVDDDA